jgi:restriction endonuclease S subunit
MQTSTIKFSQIEDRIDAEYYKPEYLILNSKLKVQNSKFLDDLSQIITKGETPLWRGDVYISKGIPFLRVVNFINEELDLSDIVYIPEFVHERMKRSQLKPGDVLLSMAGRIGTAVIVLEELKVANINQAIAKIRLKEGLINKYYLIVFLNSKYGLYQSLRKASGGVQNNINFEDIKSIKIPTPSQSFQQKIEKMVKEAQEKRKLADEK